MPTTTSALVETGFAPLLKPIRSSEFGFWQAYHLLNRAGFGGTPDQVQLLADWGVEKSVEHLVAFADTTPLEWPKDRFDSTIMSPLSPEQRAVFAAARENQREDIVEEFRQRRQERQRTDRRQVRDMQKWWLGRMIETPRPLEEKMTLFWHGHFATGYRKIENSFHMLQQNQLFRKHATGNFGDLCFQIIRDPAMIAYLDNNRSNRQSPNENLARELMELFTLGEGQVYREQDIKEGARALTGYTFRNNAFFFNERLHDDQPKRIFGKSGNFDGDDFVRLILSRPETSHFIAWKLYRFFVNDLPAGPDKTQQAFIKALAIFIRKSKYDLAPVLTTLFRSQHFYDATNANAQIKSPVQLVVQCARSLKTPIMDINVLVEACDLMGQNILEPPSVKGWNAGRAWINTSTLFVRQNIITHLLTGKMPNGYSNPAKFGQFDPMPLLKSLGDSPGGYSIEQAIEYLAHFTFGQKPSSGRLKPLVDFGSEHGMQMDKTIATGVLCLISAMPEYQLC